MFSVQGEAKINEARLKGRYTLILIFFALCFSVLVVRLSVLQVVKREEYLQKAKNNIESKTTLKADRGIIYDRNMVPLALNVTTYRIYLSPRDIKDEKEAETVASGLSRILGCDYETVLSGAKNNKTRDRTVKQKATEEEKKQVIDFVVESGLSHCVHTEASSSRYYPYGELAAHVIGVVGTDGGLFGVEAYYDAYLKGENGYYITQKNASGESLPNSEDTFVKAVNGSDVILTIDITLQSLLEAQLKETYIDSKAQDRVTGVAMDPETGEVLAMATYPSFDLNKPYILNEYYLQKLAATGFQSGSNEYKKSYNDYLYQMWNNKAVSTLYEPGSTFKIITTSVALEEKVSNVNEGFHCSGALKIDGYGTPIRCHKRTGHGSLNFAEALQKSCNPTMIKLAQRVGNKKFMEYFKAFGYTGKTGIDLPGEALGIFHEEEGFNNVELSVYSFGQTFKTTAIQQICAVSAVANGGTLVTPFVVKEIREPNGNTVYSRTETDKHRVLSEDVCATINKILADGVSGDGGAKNAGVAGYDIAAKTGTSQIRDIRDENGNSYLYVGSCVAFAPSKDSSIAAIIVVDKPMCQNYYGSTVAAPYVSAFLAGALPYLGIEPSFTAEQEAKLNVSIGDYRTLSVSEAKKEIAKLGIKVTVVGNGETVISQTPVNGSKISRAGGQVVLYTGGEEKTTAKVPKVEGLTATEAIKLLLDSGFNVRLEGATDYDKGVGARVIKQSISEAEAEKGSLVTLWLRYLDSNE